MDYLIKSSALIIVFYLCYKLLLQRDTFFQTNRWFLLLGLLISFCLPFIVIPIYITKEISAQFIGLNSNTIIENAQTEVAFNWMNLFLYIYITGILFLSIRLISQLISLAFILFKGYSTKQDGYIYINTNKAIAPFSFFNYIVYNSSNFSNQELEHIINHEKIHANQNHSIDILITHIASIICWFNPFVWLYKKDLQQNLEFIADNEALSNSNCKKTYQYVLLKTSVPNYQMALTNNFYNSLIKKRIVMLHKNKSKKRNQIKILFILPLLAIFLMSFSTKEIITYKTIENKATELITETTPKVNLTETQPELKPVNQKQKKSKKQNVNGDVDIIVITKNTTDKELDVITEKAKKNGVTLKFRSVKRNKDNEITAIKISAKSKNSNASISQTEDDAIDPITIKIEDGSISIGDGHDSGHRDYVFETHDGKTKILKSSSASNVFVYSNSDDHDNHEVIEEDDKIIIKSDGKVKEIKKGKSSKNIWLNSDDDQDNIEVIEEDGKIIIKSNGVLKEIKNIGKGKSIFVTSDSDHDKHEIIDILENDGKTVTIKKGKDGKIFKTTTSSLWVSDDEDSDEDSILEIKKGDKMLFISDDSDNGKKPLIVINGNVEKYKKLKDLDPNTIETINVIKGEAALKKYGKKGKNGVIEITTKN